LADARKTTSQLLTLAHEGGVCNELLKREFDGRQRETKKETGFLRLRLGQALRPRRRLTLVGGGMKLCIAKG
jgi:hypothetical protein